MNTRFSKNGFTIIETVIYTGILVILVSVVITSLVGLARSYSHFTTIRRVGQSASVAFDFMTKEIRFAQMATTTGTLPTEGLDLTEVSGYTVGNRDFTVQGGILKADTFDITTNDVTISRLDFTIIDDPAASSTAVKIEMDIVSTSTNNSIVTETFYNTVVLRSSYVAE